MIKRLGTFAAACALIAGLVPMLSAPARATGCTTSPCSFSVSATVKTIATISFPSSFTYTWSNVTDNTNNALQSDATPGSATIGGSIRSTSGTGTAQVYFTAPSTVPGSSANIPISAFSYTCTGSYVENTGAGAGGGTLTTNTVNLNTTSAAVVSGSNNYCVNLSSGHSIGSLAVVLNLFLDDRYIPADTYTSSGFAATVSAT